MKRIILTVVLVFATITAFSQARLAIPFTDFEKWVKQIKIAEYPFMESQNDESDYSAMFASGPTKVLQVRVGDLKRFGDYKFIAKDAPIYTWNTHRAVYYFYADITIITIEVLEAQIFITFGVNGKATKAVMEGIATKANIQNLRIPSTALASTLPAGVKWPLVIPEDIRISSVESIKSLGTDGNVNLTSTDKLDFICAQAESVHQQQNDFKIGEPVLFMYYIKY